MMKPLPPKTTTRRTYRIIEDDEDETASTASDSDSNSSDVSSASTTSSESTGAAERCPICLSKFKEQDLGKPNNCDHLYCLECIEEWSKNTNTCPVDRKVYNEIIAQHAKSDKCFKKIKVKDRDQQNEDNIEYIDVTYCEVCAHPDREDVLLLCDGCDHGYHIDCLNPPLTEIPSGQWYCPVCVQDSVDEEEEEDDVVFQPVLTSNITLSNVRQTRLRERIAASPLNMSHRHIARTRYSERVRRNINRSRLQRGATIVVSETDEDDDDEDDDVQEVIEDDEELELLDELCELDAVQPTTSRRAAAATASASARPTAGAPTTRTTVKKRRKKTRKRRRKTAANGGTRRKTRRRRKKPKRLVKKRNSRRIGSKRVVESPCQERIKTVLRSYQSLPKTLEEREEEKRRVGSNIKVFKAFEPTLDSEFYDSEEPKPVEAETKKPENYDVLASILESQKRLFVSGWEGTVRPKRERETTSESTTDAKKEEVKKSVLERLLPRNRAITTNTSTSSTLCKSSSEPGTSSSLLKAAVKKEMSERMPVVVLSPLKVPPGIKFNKISISKSLDNNIASGADKETVKIESNPVNSKNESDSINSIALAVCELSPIRESHKRRSRSRERHRHRSRSRSLKRRHRSRDHQTYTSNFMNEDKKPDDDSVIEITPIKAEKSVSIMEDTAPNTSSIASDSSIVLDNSSIQEIVKSIYGDKHAFDESFDESGRKNCSEDEIIKAAKDAIKPYYVRKKITKDEYKLIMRKVVNHCLHENKTKKIESSRVTRMIVAYVNKTRSNRSSTQNL